jgi:hypothetical protein
MSDSPPPFMLRTLSPGTKLGLTCLLLTLFGGYVVAAVAHLHEHHRNRDGDPGMSLRDIRGVYAGLDEPSPLLAAIRAGHPAEVPPPEGATMPLPPTLDPDLRDTLIRWLESSNIEGNYENPDLGAFTPEEIIQDNCLFCHSSRLEPSPTGRGQGEGFSNEGADSSTNTRTTSIPLDTWSDIQKVAFAIKVNPVDSRIMLMSMHAHAPTMAVIAIVLSLMLAMSCWPRWLVGGVVLFAGLGLLIDLGSWFLAARSDVFTYLIAAGGAVHTAAMAVAMLLLIIDLWRPCRE